VRLLSDERFVDLEANLQYFHDKYDATLTEQDEANDTLASVRGDPYRRFRRLHHDYIEAQRDEVDSMLETLKTLDDSSDKTENSGQR